MTRSLFDYRLLATDYDGTLAGDGRVAGPVLDGLRRLRAAGRHVVLVTGRELVELTTVCPHLDLFDRVVAENGAVLFRPATAETVTLAAPPDARLLDWLRSDGVEPLVVGRVIVATRTPHDRTVAAAIDRFGLPLRITYNKGAVMVLPTGVDKASGLRHALAELRVSAADAIGIGDAENDEPFLDVCGLSAAVANAVDSFKHRAHLVTAAPAGEGVLEVIHAMLAAPSTTSPSV
jgi:hydroxymethylpyrimidine pyrophosphatase-like HAD family hydrolase